MIFSEHPLTLTEAIDHARAAGLTVEVMAGFASRTHDLLIALETVDNEPILSLRSDRAHSAVLLTGREQSGPERWDYPYSATEYLDRFSLRIIGRGGVVDVPLLPAALGIVERYGLVEDLALSAPARVDRKKFEEALTQVRQVEERQPQSEAISGESPNAAITACSEFLACRSWPHLSDRSQRAFPSIHLRHCSR